MPQTDTSSDSYNQLRSWYLARLRKTALTEGLSSSLTPASLVQRDRAALEKLITRCLDELQSDSRAKRQNFLNFARQHLGVLTSISFIIFADLLGLAWLLTVIPEHVSHIAWITGTLLVLSCAVAVTLCFAFYQLHSTLSAVTKHEQAIADYALDAFWSFDSSICFTALSPATKRLWGYESIELLGTNLKSLVVAKAAAELERCFNAAKQSKFPERLELQINRRDRATADIEITVEYSASSDSYYCVVSDITERKEAERYKQQVMQMLSHDLKSPLTALQFSLALIAKGKYGALSDEGQQMATLGEKNIDRLIALINQLLDLHKLDAKRLDLKYSDVKLKELVSEAVRISAKSG